MYGRHSSTHHVWTRVGHLTTHAYREAAQSIMPISGIPSGNGQNPAGVDDLNVAHFEPQGRYVSAALKSSIGGVLACGGLPYTVNSQRKQCPSLDCNVKPFCLSAPTQQLPSSSGFAGITNQKKEFMFIPQSVASAGVRNLVHGIPIHSHSVSNERLVVQLGAILRCEAIWTTYSGAPMGWERGRGAVQLCTAICTSAGQRRDKTRLRYTAF